MPDLTDLAPLKAGGAAVITGAASGIGLAAAYRFASLGLSVVMADLPGERLDNAQAAVAAASPLGAEGVAALGVDVAKAEDLELLRDLALARFSRVSVLMNNAGVGLNPGKTWGNGADWQRLMAVNLWGAIHGVQAFVPAMLDDGGAAYVINTGSKQGITLPPGNPAYNVSKAALKAYTESLQHELRNTPNCQITAHLLIPGFTYTGITASTGEKPAAAWTGEQVVGFMLESLAAGDFYILCPDNDVARSTDEGRMKWAVDDIVLNRPALSRWHPDYAQAFAAFMAKGE
jgi:NAD(P)-dependent dehydrogenase (short-subunit alcohol dehydrogenase family)